MKIIVDNLEEYNELLRTCEYLHDFTVEGTRRKDKIRIKKGGGLKNETIVVGQSHKSAKCYYEYNENMEVIGKSLDADKLPLLNLLMGLHDCDDTPEFRIEHVEIRGQKNAIPCPDCGRRGWKKVEYLPGKFCKTFCETCQGARII